MHALFGSDLSISSGSGACHGIPLNNKVLLAGVCLSRCVHVLLEHLLTMPLHVSPLSLQ